MIIIIFINTINIKIINIDINIITKTRPTSQCEEGEGKEEGKEEGGRGERE